MFWEEVHYISCVGSFFFFFFLPNMNQGALLGEYSNTYGTDLKPPYNKTCQYSSKKQLLCLIEPWNRKPIESLDLWLLLKLMKTFPLMLIYTQKKKINIQKNIHAFYSDVFTCGRVNLPSLHPTDLKMFLIWSELCHCNNYATVCSQLVYVIIPL